MDLREAVSLSLLLGCGPRAPRRGGGALQAAWREAVWEVGPDVAALEHFLASPVVRDPRTRPALEAARLEAAGALRRAATARIEPIGWGDSRYPALLACIADPPPVLWLRGDPDALHGPAVAIVGSRAASPYAVEVATRLGEDLAGRGLIVVSGMARGVDSAAHRGALAAGGRTAAVLGCGVDVVYPPEHDELAERIARRGAILSELPPGAPPRPFHFPARNRIISGVALAVVVVEASERSGSLITARTGLEQGRDVMAVPGSVLSGRNRGSHGLLKDGAKVVEQADDIVDELGWPRPGGGRGADAEPAATDPIVQRMLDGEPYDVDALVQACGLEPRVLLPRLLDLELRGLVSRAPGGRFVRVCRRC